MKAQSKRKWKKPNRKTRKRWDIQLKNRLRVGGLFSTKLSHEFLKEFEGKHYSLIKFILRERTQYKGYKYKLTVWPRFGYDGEDIIHGLVTVVYGMKLIKL